MKPNAETDDEKQRREEAQRVRDEQRPGHRAPLHYPDEVPLNPVNERHRERDEKRARHAETPEAPDGGTSEA